ncbi:MAG TPA: serine/threonine-protein kinase [Vicinamibacteria bacterium]
MPPEALRPKTRSGLAGPSEAVDSRLLQERLRLFGGIAFLISAVFNGVGRVLAWLGKENPPTPAAQVALVAILLLMGGTWLYCRGRARSEGTLRALDVLLMLAMGALALVVPSGSIPEPDLRGMVMLLAVTLVLYTRAIFVPSSARRTLAVSAIAALPLAVYSLSNETVRLSVWKVMWLLASITVATAGSAVIYGLRREVRHARQLGQYTLEEKLGEGGMGVVYRARHAMLRRPTAVKLLRPERMGEAGLRRFEREVQLTASLSHPNTVTVFDYGRTPDGVFYYAMELLDGLGLDRLVETDGPQPPARVVHVLRQVLGALAEAHGIGLVHRDVKPGNVILCERGGLADVAKVVDFGLVKDLEAEAGASHDATLVGTPLYLAPEAIRAPVADARSDLYSTGAVAYFLLTGRHVFEGRTIIEICGHHLHTEPTPPSERLGRPVPPALEAWVLDCLEKDPARRPASAAEAAARLERCGTVGDWSQEEARAWWTAKGRPFAASRRGGPTPDAATLSRPQGGQILNLESVGADSRFKI